MNFVEQDESIYEHLCKCISTGKLQEKTMKKKNKSVSLASQSNALPRNLII